MTDRERIQETLRSAQKQLEETEVGASVGGGAVTVVMNAQPKVVSVTIKPEVVDADDVEMLQDLVTAAVNEGLEKIRQAQTQQLVGLTGGLNIPGL